MEIFERACQLLFPLLAVSCLTTLTSVSAFSNGKNSSGDCIEIEAAFRYKDSTYLFSEDVYIQLDDDNVEVSMKNINEGWEGLGQIDAAVSFDGYAFFFKDQVYYYYIFLLGTVGPFSNKRWGTEIELGVDAVAQFGDRTVFAKGCQYFVFGRHGFEGTYFLEDEGLPCNLDAGLAFADGQVGFVKYDQIWYLSENMTFSGAFDANEVFHLELGSICNEEEAKAKNAEKKKKEEEEEKEKEAKEKSDAKSDGSEAEKGDSKSDDSDNSGKKPEGDKDAEEKKDEDDKEISGINEFLGDFKFGDVAEMIKNKIKEQIKRDFEEDKKRKDKNFEAEMSKMTKRASAKVSDEEKKRVEKEIARLEQIVLDSEERRNKVKEYEHHKKMMEDLNENEEERLEQWAESEEERLESREEWAENKIEELKEYAGFPSSGGYVSHKSYYKKWN